MTWTQEAQEIVNLELDQYQGGGYAPGEEDQEAEPFTAEEEAEYTQAAEAWRAARLAECLAAGM